MNLADCHRDAGSHSDRRIRTRRGLLSRRSGAASIIRRSSPDGILSEWSCSIAGGRHPARSEKHKGVHRFILGVQDIEAIYSSLSNQGVQSKAPPHVVNCSAKLEIWLTEFVDPDGNQLALMSRSTANSGVRCGQGNWHGSLPFAISGVL